MSIGDWLRDMKDGIVDELEKKNDKYRDCSPAERAILEKMDRLTKNGTIPLGSRGEFQQLQAEYRRIKHEELRDEVDSLHTRTCRNCGEKYKAINNYCPNCGKYVGQ